MGLERAGEAVLPIDGMGSAVSKVVAAHLQRLLAPHGMKKRLADRLGMVSSAITPYVQGQREPSLTMLEAVSELAQVPLAELVAPPDAVLKQLNPDEAALLRWLRAWPLSVTQNLVQFVAFFADEPQQARQTRNLHELWRGLKQPEREWLYGVAVMLREKTLTPDLQAALVQRLEDEAKHEKSTTSRTRGRK